MGLATSSAPALRSSTLSALKNALIARMCKGILQISQIFRWQTLLRLIASPSWAEELSQSHVVKEGLVAFPFTECHVQMPEAWSLQDPQGRVAYLLPLRLLMRARGVAAAHEDLGRSGARLGVLNLKRQPIPADWPHLRLAHSHS